MKGLIHGAKWVSLMVIGLVFSVWAAEWRGFWGGQSIYPGTEAYERGRWEQRPICWTFADSALHRWTEAEKAVARAAIATWTTDQRSPLRDMVFEGTSLPCAGRSIDIVLRWEGPSTFFRDFGDPNRDGMALDLRNAVGFYVPWRVAPPIGVEPCPDLQKIGALDRCSVVFLNLSNPAGWFIDATPESDEEFEQKTVTVCGVQKTMLKAKKGGPAAGKQDLFTVIAHEFGHALGLVHSGGCDKNPLTGPPHDDDGLLMWEGFLTTRRDLASKDMVRGLDERVRPDEPEFQLLGTLYSTPPPITIKTTCTVGTGGSCSSPTPFLASVAITEVQVVLINCNTGQPLPLGTKVTFVFTSKPGVAKIKSDADIQSITILVDGYQRAVIKTWQILKISVPGPFPVTVKVIFLGTVCLKPM